MKVRVVECTDYDVNYGILDVKDKSVDEIQNKIYEIKNMFNKNENLDWTIDDVFMNFPIDWDWDFISGDDVVEI